MVFSGFSTRELDETIDGSVKPNSFKFKILVVSQRRDFSSVIILIILHLNHNS